MKSMPLAVFLPFWASEDVIVGLLEQASVSQQLILVNAAKHLSSQTVCQPDPQDTTMLDTKSNETTDFFVNGKMMRIRRVSPSDRVALMTQDEIEQSGDYIRLGSLPEPGDITLGTRISNDDVIVHAVFLQEDHIDDVDDDHPLALSILVDSAVPGIREMSIVTLREFVDTRLPGEIASVLLRFASAAGAMAVTTTDSTSNIHMRKLADNLKLSVRMEPNAKGRVVRYTAQTDQHPGTVKI